eukprot:4256610-Prorocentrum_lima.AAC.1
MARSRLLSAAESWPELSEEEVAMLRRADNLLVQWAGRNKFKGEWEKEYEEALKHMETTSIEAEVAKRRIRLAARLADQGE